MDFSKCQKKKNNQAAFAPSLSPRPLPKACAPGLCPKLVPQAFVGRSRTARGGMKPPTTHLLRSGGHPHPPERASLSITPKSSPARLGVPPTSPQCASGCSMSVTPSVVNGSNVSCRQGACLISLESVHKNLNRTARTWAALSSPVVRSCCNNNLGCRHMCKQGRPHTALV